MATIKDIAQLTNVSTATVSNVLNGKSGAAGIEKAKEILETAKKLDYQPNMLAKNLKLQRTNTIGVITEDLTVFNTPEIVDGIDEVCEKKGFEIILANMRLHKRYQNDFSDTDGSEKLFYNILLNLRSKQIEGVIYVGYHCREIPYLPENEKLPFVYAYCFPKKNAYPSVLFNDEKAGYDVVRLLLSKGHKKIGIISGPMDNYNAQVRLKGVQRALYEAGILYNVETTKFGDWEQSSGYYHTDALLAQNVTAIFAFNDIMATGVYKRCLELGLTIGKDISLIGYDNKDVDERYAHPLASVEIPLNEMGRKSADLVIQQIGQQPLDLNPIYLPCTIRDRSSLGSLI